MKLLRAHGHDGACDFVPRRPTIDDELRLAESVDRAWRVGHSCGRDEGIRIGIAVGSLVTAAAYLAGRVLWL